MMVMFTRTWRKLASQLIMSFPIFAVEVEVNASRRESKATSEEGISRSEIRGGRFEEGISNELGLFVEQEDAKGTGIQNRKTSMTAIKVSRSPASLEDGGEYLHGQIGAS
jgi:hypothetical protein